MLTSYALSLPYLWPALGPGRSYALRAVLAPSQLSRAIARAELPGADDFARESLASDLRRCAEILARHA